MFDIINYYQSEFPLELNKYCEHRLEDLKIKDSLGTRNIQVLRIADGFKDYGNIIPYQPFQREAFFICLYFIVLTDLALYTHFKQFYTQFEEQTKFPKVMFGFMGKPAPPYCTLDEIEKNEHTIYLFSSLTDFFIKEEWEKNLPKICNVQGKQLMDRIISDGEFARFGKNELELTLKEELKKHCTRND
jgi:hypothetical protein